jgi:hypothetical protein
MGERERERKREGKRGIRDVIGGRRKPTGRRARLKKEIAEAGKSKEGRAARRELKASRDKRREAREEKPKPEKKLAKYTVSDVASKLSAKVDKRSARRKAKRSLWRQ